MFMKKCCEFLLFVHQTPNPLHFCGCTSNLNFSNFVLVSIIFYFKVVKNSAKMMMGKLQRLWSLSLVWLLTPLLLDSASEVMFSMAQEQFFSKTDNCRNIRYGGDPALVHPSVEGLQKLQVFPCWIPKAQPGSLISCHCRTPRKCASDSRFCYTLL